MKFKQTVITLLSLLLSFQISKGQVVIKELVKKNDNAPDSLLFGYSKTRKIINLNGIWKVYIPDETENKKSVYVPSNFTGEDVLVYEKELNLDPNTILQKHLRVIFLGLNYSAEIILNNLVIYKHPGGDFPVKVDLPRDILKTNNKNVLAVKLFHKLSSDESIPVLQRFLFPENYGGIFRDVFLEVTPRVFISEYKLHYQVSTSGKILLNINTKFTNNSAPGKNDSLINSNSFTCRYRLISDNGEDKLNPNSTDFTIQSQKEQSLPIYFEANNLLLWTPQTPTRYKLSIQLWQNENLIDEIIKPVSFYSLIANKESLTLNGQTFTLNGTTYFAEYPNNSNLASFEQMQQDIRIIKSIGFNAIRFAKQLPHPYLLNLCEEYGLLAFIELPINSIPIQIYSNKNYQLRTRSYLLPMINSYENYSAVAGIGLGSSYLSDSEEQISFLNRLAALAKKNFDKITYASFIGYNIPPIENIDFYGLEIFNKQDNNYQNKIENLEQILGKGKIFISEATYASYFGNSNGYLNPFSFEAQAKFFSEILDFCIDKNRPGYFLNSIFDYKGDYSPMSTGFSDNNIYKIGILNENREINRLSQRVIYSKLHNTEKVTIPIGSKKDDSPMVFILYGMVLALLIGFVVNSKRKFREDATRALFRPYNFFSDVRDQRILSGFHSNFLMLMLSGTSALLLSNLLFYFKDNILLEKIILAFGMPSFSKWIAYLAWNPNQAVIWLMVVSIVFFFALTILVNIASFFVRNKVYLSSAYFTVTWSFLPLLLLLPLGLILYRILNAEFVTLYLLLALVFFTVWIYYRLMKGIYVIFDINPGTVYMYSLIFIFFVAGGVLLYFQFSNSTVYFIMNAFKQYSLM
jgi:beta-galactosidase